MKISDEDLFFTTATEVFQVKIDDRRSYHRHPIFYSDFKIEVGKVGSRRWVLLWNADTRYTFEVTSDFILDDDCDSCNGCVCPTEYCFSADFYKCSPAYFEDTCPFNSFDCNSRNAPIDPYSGN